MRPRQHSSRPVVCPIPPNLNPIFLCRISFALQLQIPLPHHKPAAPPAAPPPRLRLPSPRPPAAPCMTKSQFPSSTLPWHSRQLLWVVPPCYKTAPVWLYHLFVVAFPFFPRPDYTPWWSQYINVLAVVN